MKWPIVKLGDIFVIERGGSPRPIDDYISDASDAVNWISIRDASESSKYITKTRQKIRVEGVKKSRLVHPGDFLLTNSMSFGRPYILKTTGCIHDGWLVLSDRSNSVNQDFFYHLLGSPYMYQQFSRKAAGAVVKNLNIDLVKGVSVPLPPLAEQRRIAAILDKADAVRRKRQEAIRLTDALLRSAFLEMFGDIAAKRSKYKFGNVRNLTRMESGKSSKSVLTTAKTAIPVYGGNGINGYATKPLYEEPVMVVGRVGQQCGIVHLTDGPAWVTDNAIVVQSIDSEKLDPVYLAYAFQMSPIRDTVTHLDLPFINQDMLKDMSIPLPPPAEQHRFAMIRNKVLMKRYRVQSAVDETSILFSALVHLAFRGRL